MNKFVLLCCIGFSANLAAARPDLSLGYKYNQGTSSAGASFLQAPVGNNYQATASSNSYFNAAPATGQQPAVSTGFAQNSDNGGSNSYQPAASGDSFFNVGQPVATTSFAQSNSNNGDNFLAGSTSNNNPQFIGNSASSGISNDQQQQQQQNQAPIISKHYYLYKGPAEHDEKEIVRYINVGQPRKNYNVVFIDAPSSNVNRAKIVANVAPTEDKTAIYVLAQKSNVLDIDTEVVTPAPTQNKPEVFFVKYRTPEEHNSAHQKIQAQYEALGGSSDINDEGLVPVSSVIGSLGDSSSSDGSSSSAGGSASAGGGFNGQYSADQTQNVGTAVNVVRTGVNTQQTYLPPPVQNRYRFYY